MNKIFLSRNILGTNKGKNAFLGFALCLMFTCTQAWAVELGIENDEDYDKLLTALHATEYVRNDYMLADTPKPRVYAALAAVMAYSERNPNASGAQLKKFLEEFDLAARNFASGGGYLVDPCAPNPKAACDPDLSDPATFLAALRLTIVSDPMFVGTDTEIGEQALKLLGVTIPDPNGFSSISGRMVDFEMALARPLQYRNEVFDLLVAGFFGQDPAGNERTTLPAILNSYFKSEGYDPEFGNISTLPAQANVNAGLAMMPANYAVYADAISDGTTAHGELRAQVLQLLDSIRTQTNDIVDVLANEVENAPGFAESVDPLIITDAYIQEVIDERRAHLQDIAAARAASSAATYMMLQSQSDEIGVYVDYTRKYSEISLDTNESAADFKAGVQIAGSLLGAAVGGSKWGGNDKTAIIGGLASAANLMLGLAVNEPPSIDEQNHQQLQELRAQVDKMRIDMGKRFDRIDKKLNIMYDTITNGLNQITWLSNEINGNVNELVEDMAEAQSQLRRIELSLYNLTAVILDNDLVILTDLALDYFDNEGSDLPYDQGNPSFVTTASELFSYTTTTSSLPAYSGEVSEPVTLISNASTYLTDDVTMSGFLNPLAVLPFHKFGLSELANSAIPGIEPWSQGGSAYAQFGRENPWYLRYQYEVQVQNASEPDLDQIILKGEEIVEFVEAIRKTDAADDINSATGSSLFDALIENYRTAVNAFQDQIDIQLNPANLSGEIVAPCIYTVTTDFGVQNPKCVRGGTQEQTKLDLWSSDFQEEVIKNLIGFRFSENRIDENNGTILGGFKFQPGLSSQQGAADLQFFPPECDAPSFCGLGWNTFTDGSEISNHWLRAWYFVQEANGVSPGNLKPRFSVSSEVGFFSLDFWIGGINQRDAFPVWRQITFQFSQNGAPLFPNDPVPLLSNIWANPEFTFDSFRRDVTKFIAVPSLKEYKNSVNSISLTTATNFRARNPLGANDVLPGWYGALSNYRKEYHGLILDELAMPNSDLAKAAKKVDDAVALLNAYVTIGMPKELDQSEVLRSALRLPGGDDSVISDMRLASMIGMVLDIDDKDKTDDFADPDFNINKVMDILNSRADIVAEEIKLGLQRPAFAPDYVSLVLAELRHLRSTAFDLAVDDTYLTDANGRVSVDATPDPKYIAGGENTGAICPDPRWLTGLLGNDAKQGCSAVTIDTDFGPDDDGYIAPNSGSVAIDEDGTFTYVANPGFNGTDSFTYRAKASVNGNVVYSNPATVVITTENVQSGELIFEDGLEGGAP